MQAEGIKAYLSYLGVDVPYQQGRQGWVVAPCPLARWNHAGGKDDNPSFGVKIEHTERSHFYCFSCGAHGDLEDLVLELKLHKSMLPHGVRLGAAMDLAGDELEGVEFSLEEPEVKQPKFETIAFPEHWVQSFAPAWKFEPARKYLVGRGLSRETVERLDLKFDTTLQTVGFPIRAYDGSLVGLHGRKITPAEGGPKYHAYKYGGHWNRLPWLGEHRVDPDKTVILVESVFDYAAVEPLYGNVLAALSAGISKQKAERISACYDVVTLFDHGTGGDTARSLISKYLTGAALVHLIPNGEYGDPGEYPQAELRELLALYVDV